MLNLKEKITAKIAANKEKIHKIWFRSICVLVFTFAALSTYGITYLLTGAGERFINEIKADARKITSDAGLTLAEVFVKGRNRTSKNEIIHAMAVKRGMPMIAIDLENARKNLEALPWVESASIERRMPNLVHVNITERQPIALWQQKGQYFPIDANGKVVNAGIKGLEKLPLVVGKDAPEFTPELISILSSQPGLLKRTKAAVRIGNRRWDVVLDDVNKGISISLPENNPLSAWARLAQLEKNHGLLKRKLTMVDLRLPDKLTVRLDEKRGKSLYDPKRNIKIRPGIEVNGRDA